MSHLRLSSSSVRFILREGRLPLTGDVLKSLAENAVYPNDRQQCFRWFANVRLNLGLFIDEQRTDLDRRRSAL